MSSGIALAPPHRLCKYSPLMPSLRKSTDKRMYLNLNLRIIIHCMSDHLSPRRCNKKYFVPNLAETDPVTMMERCVGSRKKDSGQLLNRRLFFIKNKPNQYSA